jgi:hypothetical protein
MPAKRRPNPHPGNDSRDNLLRLLSEAKSFALPVQAIPADVSRTRDVYFAWHPEWDSASLPPRRRRNAKMKPSSNKWRR